MNDDTSIASGSVRVRPAAKRETAPILALLMDADLPTAGVTEWVDQFFVAELDGTLIGVAGLEVHGTDGLLRSVAVAERARSRGVGRALASRVIDAASSMNLNHIYLLTTTAEEYFRRLGFRRVDRAGVPPQVQASIEFREACPASAAAMELELRDT